MPRACYGSLRAFPASRWRGGGACCVQPAEAIADALARIRTETPCGTAPSRQRVYQFHHQGGRRNLGTPMPRGNGSYTQRWMDGWRPFGDSFPMLRCVLASLFILAGCAPSTPPESLTPLPSAPTPSGDWATYNGSASGERFSPLNEIKPANVTRSQHACTFETQDTVSFQTGIVAVGGILYFTAYNTTYAIDGATCREKWRYTRAEPATFLKTNRGVAYDHGMVFRGTGDAHVLGIDAATGQLRWDVAIGDPKKGESVPMAPLAWNDLVFVGNAGGDEFGVTGRIYALDAATGRTVWQFNTVPDSGPALATWPKASPQNPPTGGATWTSYALDELTGTLYVTTGNPAPDFVLELRPGDNLYTNAVLGLDARTGRLQTYIQPIKNDFHDWDVSAAPALITTKSGAPLLIAAAKDGRVYGLERGRLPTPAGGDGTTETLALAVPSC